MNINITKISESRINKVDFDNLTFGSVFSDHMLYIDYENKMWGVPSIVPYGALELLPSICSLHYGQIVFEGMKVFKSKDGEILIFRPDKHHARLNQSSDRLCIPEIDYDLFMNSLNEFIKIDSKWIPEKRGSSLYIRPFIFATDNLLGVRVSDTYKFMILACPVASYYKEGLNPISLCTSGDYVRAVRGGLGEAKAPANYAASLLPSQIAKEKGYTQVLWLDAIEKKYIDEIGTTNIFFLINDELITPSLDGGILNGVTRNSVIELSKSYGIKVTERKISIDEVFECSEKGTLKEVFGTGTAAVISPVGKIEHKNKSIIINDGKTGIFSKKVYDDITSIQYGEKEDIFNWNYKVNI
ncbi:MAG: branched-chain amino acid aminotransferase [Candidatus Sericytochromatia bacterium]